LPGKISFDAANISCPAANSFMDGPILARPDRGEFAEFAALGRAAGTFRPRVFAAAGVRSPKNRSLSHD
jgi:hypothetical protein